MRKNGRAPFADVATTLGAAAARIGCTVSDLRRARDAGVEGFAYGRVNIPVVAKWLAENPPPAGDVMDEESLKLRKLLAQCKKLELDEAILRGEYTPNAEVVEIGVRRGAQTRAELMSLISEAPTWAGLDAANLQDRAKKFVSGALERLSNTTHKTP
jgi:hypothetical protein